MKQRVGVLVGIVVVSVAAISIYLSRGPGCAIDSRGGARFALRSTEPIDPLELEAFLKSAGVGDVSIRQTPDPAAVMLSSMRKAWGREAILNLQAALKNFGDVEIARTELLGPAARCL